MDNKRYYEGLAKRIDSMARPKDIGVGFDEQMHSNTLTADAKYPQMPMTYSMLAQALCFGFEDARYPYDGNPIRVPGRNFMHDWMEDTDGVSRVVDYAREHYLKDFDWEKVADIMEMSIRELIHMDIYVPNSERVIPHKQGGEVPLIDTGELINNIRHITHKGED